MFSASHNMSIKYIANFVISFAMFTLSNKVNKFIMSTLQSHFKIKHWSCPPVPGNDTADKLAKRGAALPQQIKPATYDTTCQMIKSNLSFANNNVYLSS